MSDKTLEKVVVVNIYQDDTYYEIVDRFMEQFDDEGIIDGMILKVEESKKG